MLWAITKDNDPVAGFGWTDSFGSATLELELAGFTKGDEYDHLDIAGQFAIDGTLDVQLIGGFNPQLGDSFDLLDFDSLTGSFSDIRLPTLNHGLAFDTTSLLIDGTLSVVPEPASVSVVAIALACLAKRRRRPAAAYSTPQTNEGRRGNNALSMSRA